MRPIPTKVGIFVAMIGMLFVVSGCGQSDGPGAGRSGTTIEGRYEIQGLAADVVRDAVTGLEWQRCSLGQRWDGRTCTGEAKVYERDEARHAANDIDGWRLPTIDELRTLIHCSSGHPARFHDGDGPCQGEFQRPTIVNKAFPNTPSLSFWSGSPRAPNPDYAWVLNFSRGYAGGHFRTGRNPVRLVRSSREAAAVVRPGESYGGVTFGPHGTISVGAATLFQERLTGISNFDYFYLRVYGEGVRVVELYEVAEDLSTNLNDPLLATALVSEGGEVLEETVFTGN